MEPSPGPAHPTAEPTDRRRATLFALVGLPGAGKTTRSREIAAKHNALRLSPDEWMLPLFGASDPDGLRDVMEGRLIWVAARVLRSGTSVVLDFGLWSRDERLALRALAAAEGAMFETVYLPIDAEAQRTRVAERWSHAPHKTFPMSDAEVARGRDVFEEPSGGELAASCPLPPAPEGHESWAAWTAWRWPTSITP